jgi:hypothetical protein
MDTLGPTCQAKVASGMRPPSVDFPSRTCDDGQSRSSHHGYESD